MPTSVPQPHQHVPVGIRRGMMLEASHHARTATWRRRSGTHRCRRCSSGHMGGQRIPVSRRLIRNGVNEVLERTGLTDSEGQPLDFAPHDFRRNFITDAIRTGLPPHIAQVLAGHSDLNATMGYNAIYPADAIEAHRASIARRRPLRPSEEYRDSDERGVGRLPRPCSPGTARLRPDRRTFHHLQLPARIDALSP
ncbi:site-specific integrase [Streptomyces avermitilis]|uniref:site-specific integrase n=1 Tax=Streptomyces avermitilis TaxID=33903 RepID=UPI0033AA9B03